MDHRTRKVRVMGRQIIFYQLGCDIEDLMNFLKENNLYIFTKSGEKITEVSNLYKEYLYIIAKQYSGKFCGVEYSIPLEPKYFGVKKTRFYFHGDSYIEKEIGDIVAINDGRFYMPNEVYENKESMMIYKMLVEYIKKKRKYIYCKELSSYFSPSFIESYKLGNVFPANCNNIYTIVDI